MRGKPAPLLHVFSEVTSRYASWLPYDCGVNRVACQPVGQLGIRSTGESGEFESDGRTEGLEILGFEACDGLPCRGGPSDDRMDIPMIQRESCKRASQRLLNFLLSTRSQKSRNSAMADSAQDKGRGAKSARSIVNEFGDPISNLRGSRTIDPPIRDVLGTDLLQP
jgi:hypothetical protein